MLDDKPEATTEASEMERLRAELAGTDKTIALHLAQLDAFHQEANEMYDLQNREIGTLRAELAAAREQLSKRSIDDGAAGDAALNVLRCAYEYVAFSKSHDYPEIGTANWEEAVRLLDALETAVRHAGLAPRTGDFIAAASGNT